MWNLIEKMAHWNRCGIFLSPWKSGSLENMGSLLISLEEWLIDIDVVSPNLFGRVLNEIDAVSAYLLRRVAHWNRCGISLPPWLSSSFK